MRTDPLRAAGWCVVILAALVFINEVRRLAQAPPPSSPPAPARFVSPAPPPPSTATVQPRGIVDLPPHYVGNTNTHKFHRASCRYAGCKNCTARFDTREEALAGGYRPGGCCDP